MGASIHKLTARISPYFRRRRMREMARYLNLTEETTVLDVGGYPSNWMFLPFRAKVTFLNIHPQAQSYGPVVVGDGCRLPFADNSFDLCFSNSVIEHVGGVERQHAFATECARVGRQYYLQTPDFWFPVEPHYIGPFIHWLPSWARVPAARHFSVAGYLARDSIEGLVAEIRLLRHRDIKEMLPGSRIFHERFLGLSKSLIAIGPHPLDGQPGAAGSNHAADLGNEA